MLKWLGRFLPEDGFLPYIGTMLGIAVIGIAVLSGVFGAGYLVGSWGEADGEFEYYRGVYSVCTWEGKNYVAPREAIEICNGLVEELMYAEGWYSQPSDGYEWNH